MSDLIDRQETIEYFNKFKKIMKSMPLMDVVDRLKELPSVTPTQNCVENTLGALDLISRQAVLDTIHRFFTEEVDKIPTKKTEDGEVLVIRKCQPLFEMNKAICKRIKALQAVNPQEPKTGHWIEVIDEINSFGNKTWHHKCSICGNENSGWGEYKYCPNCGCRMVEPQESEE